MSEATLIIIAAIGAGLGGVGTVASLWNKVESGNVVTLTTRNTSLEDENTSLYAWKLAARAYIVLLTERLLDRGGTPPAAPAVLGLTPRGEDSGE